MSFVVTGRVVIVLLRLPLLSILHVRSTASQLILIYLNLLLISIVLLVFEEPELIVVLLSKPISSPNLSNCSLASDVIVQELLCKFAVIDKFPLSDSNFFYIKSKVQYPGSNLTVVEPYTISSFSPE